MANPDEMYDAAIALQEQGNTDEAVGKLEEILSVDPDHVLTHMALGVHLHKLGRMDEAVSHAVRVTELEPEDPFSFTQLSVICMRCGRIPQAEEAMAKAHFLQQARN